MSQTFTLMLWKPPPVNDRKPWRGYRTRERRDEAAQGFLKAGWHVTTRDPDGEVNSVAPTPQERDDVPA